MSNRIYIPTGEPEDWKKFLAKPSHWKTGYSAKALAYCWEEADGFPQSVRAAFQASGLEVVEDLELLLAIPEYTVPIPPGKPYPQNDVFVLARAKTGLVAVMVEGKKSEPFDDPVQIWYMKNSSGGKPSKGKQTRLKFLCDTLGLRVQDVLDANVRYQLLHRTASAVIAARDFHAKYALMLVHSFSQSLESFDDYVWFGQLLANRELRHNVVEEIGQRSGMTLYLAWVTGEAQYLTR